MIEWRRRTGLGGMAHAFEDGEPVCPQAKIPPGTPSIFQGFAVRAFEPCPVSPWGRPYGRFCKTCDTVVQRLQKERAA
jgi:hypothetical protein